MVLVSVLRFTRSAWLMSIVLFIAGMSLYTAHNDFPYLYHPDEKGKVRQIEQHFRNYKHPLMMLSATAVVTTFHWGPLTPQKIVERGRDVSAFFASISVVALALLARRMAGSAGGSLTAVLGGWSVGLIMLFDPLLFDLAHYFKEDPALVMGLALTFLSLHIFWKRRDELSVVFVGMAAASAVSGKYVGWLLFPFALWLVYAGAEPAARNRYGKLFLKCFGLMFIVFNYSLIFNPFKPFSSLGNEMEGVVWGHHGMGRNVPHGDYIQMLFNLPVAITVLFGVYIVGLLFRAKKVTPPEWLVLGFSILLLGIMSFSPKVNARYLLPIEVVIYLGAGLGLIWLAMALSSFCGRFRSPALIMGCMLFGVAVFWNAKPVFMQHFNGVAVDDRVALRQWIQANLPASSVIAEDDRVRLSFVGERYPKLLQRILDGDHGSVADLGSLEQLRKNGITHVAVAVGKYAFFEVLKPSPEIKEDFFRHKAFYASLGLLKDSIPAAGVRPVWTAPLGVNEILQPGMTLFDITGVSASK